MVELPQWSQFVEKVKEHSQWRVWAAACALAAVLFAVYAGVTVAVMGPPELRESPPASGTIGGMIERQDGADSGEAAGGEDVSAGEAGEAASSVNAGVAAGSEAGAGDAGQQQETPMQANALASAKQHLAEMPYSHAGIVSALEAEGYSHEDAVYAADKLGVDWNAEAAEMAAQYVGTMEFTRDDLIDQLVYEGFTQEQAAFGATSVGL